MARIKTRAVLRYLCNTTRRQRLRRLRHRFSPSSSFSHGINTGPKTNYKEIYRGVEVRLLVLLALSEMLPNMRGSCILPPRCCPVFLGRRDIKTEIEIFPKAGQVINVSIFIPKGHPWLGCCRFPRRRTMADAQFLGSLYLPHSQSLVSILLDNKN